MPEKKKGDCKPELIADQYIDKIVLALSVSLGLYEATNIGKQPNFIGWLCVFFLIIVSTFYFQWKIRLSKKTYDNPFVLFWRIVDKLVTFVQQFLTTVSFNIIVQKIQENDSENNTIDLRAKFMLYTVVFVFLSTILLLFGWYFYEEKSYNDLPEQLINDLTKKQEHKE